MRALATTCQLAERLLAAIDRCADYRTQSDGETPAALQRALALILTNTQQYQTRLAAYHQRVAQRKQVALQARHRAHELLQHLPPLPGTSHTPHASDYLVLLKALKYAKRQGLAPCPTDPLFPGLRYRHAQFTRSYLFLRQRCTSLAMHLRACEQRGCQSAATEYDHLGLALDQLTGELQGLYDQLSLLYQQQAALHEEVKRCMVVIRSQNGRIRYR